MAKKAVIGAITHKLAYLIYGVIHTDRPFDAHYWAKGLAIQDGIWPGSFGGDCVCSVTEVYAIYWNRWDDRAGTPAINSSSMALARNKGMLRRGI